VRGGGADVRAEARRRFFQPLLEHLSEAGVGHISEIANAEAPHTPRGCPFQAWSVGEALRLDRLVLGAAGLPRAERRPRAQPIPG
jgi:glycogen debranching enzyme